MEIWYRNEITLVKFVTKIIKKAKNQRVIGITYKEKLSKFYFVYDMIFRVLERWLANRKGIILSENSKKRKRTEIVSLSKKNL
jgi:hypothetical protein